MSTRQSIVTTTVTILVCTAFLVAAPALTLQFHVSVEGDDTAAGTGTSPFRTLERAKIEVRKMIAEGLQEPVTVFLHGGTYELTGTLLFGPEDSGTKEFPITYTAQSNETVVLSGGRKITNWRKGERGQWVADLPDVKAGKWFFRQLVVDGCQAVRSRWPNTDSDLRIASVGNGVKTFTFNKPLAKIDLAGQGTELVVFEHWSITRGLIKASDDKQVTTSTAMGWIGHGQYTTAVPGRFGYLEHGRDFLDQPGEWFLDKAAGELHYLPRKAEGMTKTVAVAPRLERLVVITGTKEKPVGNIRFKGIHFEHADFSLPAIGYNEIQAAHYGTTMKERTYVRPVAIECAWAEGIMFQRCRFAHLNPSGIGFGPGCRKNAIIGCTIEDIGGNGVMVGWRGVGEIENENLAADWKDPSDAPVGNEVVNCHIRRCGLDSRGGCGVFAAFSADTRIAHNHIHDMPYTGISIGFRWNLTPTTQMKCVVENNHIHDVMKQLADGGGIYTLGIQPSTVLRGNHIHDVHRNPHAVGSPNNGFFIDQASKGFLFEENVVYRTAGSSVRFNQSQSQWHTWKSNFFGDKEAETEEAKAIAAKAGIEDEYR
ncbi:MAG: right-handed parallel beta-helix repeat-containing protein [Phycisphaerae bacterium]|nr:right-handed parallel beta-helix repeat-containing protein [Phycisphaerae bacterium]